MASPSVPEALHALTRKASAASRTLRELKAQALAQLREQQQHVPAGHTPSGPRRKGEGVDDEQGILAAEPTPGGGARLRITLLAAGFVLGPSGSSVRDIIATTGADVRSWSEAWQGGASGAGGGGSRSTRVRTFVVEGDRRSVVHAISIISAAVDRYAELCGGAYSGQAVQRAQVIDGVTFLYSPPPRSAVPFAAALSTQERPANPPARKSLGFTSPTSCNNKENGLGGLPATPATALAPPPQPLLPLATGLLSRMPSLPEGMDADMEEMEAATPAYHTRTYSLFDGGSGMSLGAAGSLLLAPAEHPFALAPAASSSFFSSAFEAATPAPVTHVPEPAGRAAARSLFHTDGCAPVPPAASAGFLGGPTPSLLNVATAPLQRQLCFGASAAGAAAGEDALLAASGFPSFAAFAHQSDYFQPSLFGPPGSSTAAPALPHQLLPAGGALAQLPAGAAWWPAHQPGLF